MVDGILGVLLDTEIPPTQASLRTQLLILEEVKQGLEIAATMINDVIVLAADMSADFRTSGHAREQEVQMKIQEARTRAVTLGAASPQQTGAEDEKYGGENLGFPRSAQYLYKKQPFPTVRQTEEELPKLPEGVDRDCDKEIPSRV